MYEPTAYIGPVGDLVGFLGPSEQTRNDDSPVTFVDTLGGRKAFLGRPGRREWDCSLDARYPGELSGLMWLASYGNPPFVWYPADAIFGNILTPRQAAFLPDTHDGLEGPLVEVEPGVHVKSAFPDGGDYVTFPRASGLLDPIPVVAGRPLTVSAWLRGQDSRFGITWRDVSGDTVPDSGNPSPTFNVSSLTRVSRTLMPPAAAATVTLWFYADQAAGPAVTLSDTMLPYSPGKGAQKTVVHGLSESLTLVTQDLSIVSASFTVSEVG